MEIILLLGFFVLASLIAPWVALSRINALKIEVAQMQRELVTLASKLLTVHPLSKAEVPLHVVVPHQDVPHEDNKDAPLPDLSKTSSPVPYEAFDWDQTKTSGTSAVLETSSADYLDVSKEKSTFEFNIGAKLPVWIGAISLACAGFFLVKYSIDAGLLGPVPRVIIGLLFGLGLVGTGRFIADHPRVPNALRMAQGLVGAGLISLTFSLYAAVHMYHIIMPFTGFVGMVSVVGATIFLALRLGQPVALFGMIGGFLAPVLFATDEPNFIALFSYLFVLYAGLQSIMFRQKWWTLSVASLAGVLIWALLALISPDFKDSGTILSLFVLAISAMTVFSGRYELTKDDNGDSSALVMGPHLLNLLAIGGSTLILIYLQDKIHLKITDWGMSALLSLGIIGLAYFRPKIYAQAVWGKLVSDIILLALYLPHVDFATGCGVSLGLLGVYGLVPAFILRRGHSAPKSWVITQTAGAILIYLTAYFRLAPFTTHETDIYWGLIALAGALYAISQIKEWLSEKNDNDDVIAIYALTATSLLSIGLVMMLPMTYLPTAIALEIAAIFWIYQRLPIEFLQKIAKILLVVFGALHFPLIQDFSSLIASSLFHVHSPLSSELFHFEKVIQFFLLPVLGLGVASKIYSHQKVQQDIVHHTLLGGVVLLSMGASYIILRMLFQGTTPWQIPPAGFIEREMITLMIALFGVLVASYAKEKDFPKILKCGYGLIVLAIFRNIYFDMMMYNPLFDGTQNVGSLPVFNGITLTYGGGLALVMYARYQKIGESVIGRIDSILKIIALVFLFVLISLNVRQFYHGSNLEQGVMLNSELYTYSIVWLLTGLGLLAYGIKRADKNLRLAALGFLTLTIGKVFLIDASELEGLYRIFSFLGLGVSLIGLSMFYTRFMARSSDYRE